MMDDLEALDCQITGIAALLELLYQATKDGGYGTTIPSAIFAIQGYVNNADDTLQHYIHSLLEAKNHDKV